jgi:Sulfotransferase family/Tetratricopeptide repeat
VTDSASISPEADRLAREGRWAEALPIAASRVAGAAACVPGHSFLVTLLIRLGRVREAEAAIDHALTFATGSAEAYDGLAYVSTELGRHESANVLYRRAVALAPRRPRGWYNLACSERSFGRLEEAEEACERAIALSSHEYPCFLLRSELRVQTPEANHIRDLESRLREPQLDLNGRIFLGYALGKELDDVQRFDEAFHSFAVAARARRSQLRYEIADDERRLQRIARVFSQGWAGAHGLAHPQAGVGPSAHLFIVGLPRSGTTLVERILTGLGGVRSNGETDNFSHALTAAAAVSASCGDMFERAAIAEPAAVAAHYDRLAGVVPEGPRVVEKLPSNYLYVGALRRALPQCRIVWVRRSPLDSCFAMYRTLFGAAYPFSYDFEELARYYAAYTKLMSHWRNLFGATLHEVGYEELVREPQRVGAALARHCGLEWRPEATDIQSNRSVSLTASASQVRRPIYGSSSGRWRHYRVHLRPLIAALRRHGVALPDDA